MAKAAKRSHAKKVVDAKFLNDLANQIHNPNKGTYLRLCTGTLQNGPDPKDKGRTMHCGLGELYFQMTGRQPETDGVDEDGVVEECLSRTSLAVDVNAVADKTTDTIEKVLRKELSALKLPEDMIQDVIDGAQQNVDASELKYAQDEFREVLNRIPQVNDNTGCSTQGAEGTVCSEEDFEDRSAAVAELLREAADLLTER